MKKKGNILSIFLSAVLLFTIVFPFVHTFEHCTQQTFAPKQHSNSKNKTELNYQHSVTEKCFGCDQHWSLFTNPEFIVFEVFDKFVFIKIFESKYAEYLNPIALSSVWFSTFN